MASRPEAGPRNLIMLRSGRAEMRTQVMAKKLRVRLREVCPFNLSSIRGSSSDDIRNIPSKRWALEGLFESNLVILRPLHP
jgi:hypothetical protein